MEMVLRELIKDLKEKRVEGRQDLVIRGIECDSRKVEEGFLFVCIPGFNFDGHKFIPEAIKRGSRVVVVEKDVKTAKDVTVIKVPNTRYALAVLANRFYGYPSKKLQVVGIAGTNGKTTTTYLVRDVLKKAGKKVALFGTIEYDLGNRTLPASTTTPQSLELQAMLNELVNKEFEYVVMEVSTHATVLDRVTGCEFDIGVFTNISRDHMDFHKTMENYLEAEIKFFRLLSRTGRRAVINIDDPYAEHIIKNTRTEILTYGINDKNADIRAFDIKVSKTGSRFNVVTPLGETVFYLRLPGRYNVYNALAAVGVGISEGLNLNEIREAIAHASVRGRFERIDCGQSFDVIVDYAHTPDALQKALETARGLSEGRIIVVFGCGDDKDRRPLMGVVAARMSDIAILTSDNSRNEEPSEIISDIESGIKKVDNSFQYLVIEDRFEAITQALEMAKEGDLVLIAGKGHEEYQIIKDRKIPFNDRKVAERILKNGL